MELKKTPLYQKHIEAGAKIIDFGGWALPVQYKSIIEEHHAVRKNVGLFDVSHMGELIFEGEDALAHVQRLTVNNMETLKTGGARYSPVCDHNGHVLDDVLVYRISDNKYMMVVNASNTGKMELWVKSNLLCGENVSASIAQIALQGPKSYDVLSKIADEIPEKYYTFLSDVDVAGANCIVSATGYTGEKGYEIYCESGDAAVVWDALMDAGRDTGIMPCGLGARDTLRFEAGMPLYGHELTEEVTPYDAGLGRFVKLDHDFIGRDALQDIADNGGSRHLIGLCMSERGIPRAGCDVYYNGQVFGRVTSGGVCPTLGKNMAMAIVDTSLDGVWSIDVRGKALACDKVDLPFYKRA